MTPSQIKEACERIWLQPGVAAADRPAGWLDPSEAYKLHGGYWRGDPDELWRRHTRRPRGRYQRKK